MNIQYKLSSLFLLFLFSGLIYCQACTTSCSSCSECKQAIIDASGSSNKVCADSELKEPSSLTCIDLSAEVMTDVTFSCEQNWIYGDVSDSNNYPIRIDQASGFIIENCNIGEFQKGIYISGSSIRTSNDVIVRNNFFNSTEHAAVYVHQINGGITVEENTFEKCGYAIMCSTACSNNIFKSNTIKNQNSRGIYIHGYENTPSFSNLIELNTFESTGYVSHDACISLTAYTSFNTIKNNKMSHTKNGIYFSSSSGFNTITSNEFCDFVANGVEDKNGTNSGSDNTCFQNINYSDESSSENKCKNQCPTSSTVKTCTCENCLDCASKIIDDNCDIINLANDILNGEKNCIDINELFDIQVTIVRDKIFDCKNHLIQRNSSLAYVYRENRGFYFGGLYDFTIQNCRFENYIVDIMDSERVTFSNIKFNTLAYLRIENCLNCKVHNIDIINGAKNLAAVYVTKSDFMEISGLTVKNSYKGLSLYETEFIDVSDCKFSNINFYGIIMGFCKDGKYSNIEIISAGSNGVIIQRSSNNEFSDFKIHFAEDGIFFERSTDNIIKNFDIQNCEICGISFMGTYNNNNEVITSVMKNIIGYSITADTIDTQSGHGNECDQNVRNWKDTDAPANLYCSKDNKPEPLSFSTLSRLENSPLSIHFQHLILVYGGLYPYSYNLIDIEYDQKLNLNNGVNQINFTQSNPILPGMIYGFIDIETVIKISIEVEDSNNDKIERTFIKKITNLPDRNISFEILIYVCIFGFVLLLIIVAVIIGVIVFFVIKNKKNENGEKLTLDDMQM